MEDPYTILMLTEKLQKSTDELLAKYDKLQYFLGEEGRLTEDMAIECKKFRESLSQINNLN